MDDSEYESLPTERVTVHLAAGALAGVMEHCVMYPVDCVKVRSIRFTGFLLEFKNSSVLEFLCRLSHGELFLFSGLKLKYLNCLVVGWSLKGTSVSS